MSAPAPQRVSGTRPEGISEEKAAARYVREMFSRIAGRYDFLNHLLSFQMDRHWRRVVARQFRHRLAPPEARVLDLCCGTADLALALAREGKARIVCSDFSHPMLTRAAEKLRRRSLLPLIAEADALQLPFPDGAFDLVVCSFGFRNLANYRAGLAEIRRLLRSGGEVGILEFSEPRGLLKPFYSFYFHRILPRVGEWVSGVKGPYNYLPGSVDRFPAPEELVEWMRQASFERPQARRLSGGIVTLYRGVKR
ncbi:MAG TPA: ubiquinone/menaquinone biosynthesis methyltransferase [Terriglobia bacterium]|nr:ubiquinone/menaquinone biosynthesis methyltransferase [Terriglobia bacterium]